MEQNEGAPGAGDKALHLRAGNVITPLLML